jgi:hypothetical protein
MNPVSIWDDFTAEERTVMTIAIEEGYLNDVIGAFLGHPERGGAIWVFSNDTAAIRALIPRFTAVVLDMIERGLIEVREPPDAVWDSAPALTMAEVNAVLADPRTWVWSADGDNRMVMTMTTHDADRLHGG